MNFLRVFLFAMMFAMAFADLNQCDPRHEDYHLAFEECNTACIARPGCSYGYCANDHTHNREWNCKCAGNSECDIYFDEE